MNPVKKIIVIGPECTGKTTLSRSLALALQCPLAVEYARDYIDGLNRPYVQDDLWAIAIGHLGEEEKALQEAKEMLICDTDLNVIKVWSEYRFHTCYYRILNKIAESRCNLYLLTDIDIAWEDDPQREHPEPEKRKELMKIYEDIVVQSGVPWIRVSGSEEQRLQSALIAIQSII